VSLLELARMLVQAAGEGEFVVKEFPAERRKIDIGDYYSDFSLIRQRLGWQPRTPLNRALAETVAYYREHLHEYL
jgi:nucleoside-diphosphate-sugar epimerase